MQEDMYVIFENYLLNQMTIEDKMEFENQLLSDADWNEKFQLYKQLTQFLESKFSKETDDFKNNLKIISKQYVSKEENLDTSKVVSIYSKWFAIAATVVVFMSVWFFMQNSTPKYGDYNQHETAYFTERSEGNTDLRLAQDAFNEKEYQKAIVYFEKITNKDLGEEGNLFYAISLIEDNQYNKAEAILKNIKEGNSVYKEKSIWYLALSKLKQEKYDECKVILETLSKDAEEYESAQEVLKKL